MNKFCFFRYKFYLMEKSAFLPENCLKIVPAKIKKTNQIIDYVIIKICIIDHASFLQLCKC